MNIPFSEAGEELEKSILFADELEKRIKEELACGCGNCGEVNKPIEPYFIKKQICKCHYSINTKEECIISSFELDNELLAEKNL